MNNDILNLQKQTTPASERVSSSEALDEASKGEQDDREEAAKEDSGSFVAYALKHWKVLITGMVTVGILALLGAIWLYTYIFTNMHDLKSSISNMKKELIHYIVNSVSLIAKNWYQKSDDNIVDGDFKDLNK